MDIDIDLPDNFDPQQIFPNVVFASMLRNQTLVKHPCGVYLQNMAVDPITKLAAIPYHQASQWGYFKIDMLHVHLLNEIGSKDELRKLMHAEPDWSLLQNEDIVHQLFHIHNHFKLVNSIRPKSINELADCLALIRPNKQHLLNDYLLNKSKVRPHLFRTTDDDDKSSFRKSHAIAYSYYIIVQLNIIKAREQHQ